MSLGVQITPLRSLCFIWVRIMLLESCCKVIMLPRLQQQQATCHFDSGRLCVIANQFRCTSKSVDLYVGTSRSLRAVAKTASCKQTVVKGDIVCPLCTRGEAHGVTCEEALILLAVRF